jgi:hypothetical protein
MQTVSTAEDEEFKNAFSSGIDSFSSFIDLLSSVKDIMGSIENNETILDLLQFLTRRVLNVNDFDWTKFFTNFSSNIKQDGESNGGSMSGEFESKKLFKEVIEEETKRNKYIIEKFVSINEEKRKAVLKKVENFVFKRTSFIPKFSYNNSLREVKEFFKTNGEIKNKYFKENKVIEKKIDLSKEELNKIFLETRRFGISIFNDLRVEEKEIDILKYNIGESIKYKSIDKTRLVFQDEIFDAMDIVNSNGNEIITYELEGNYYLNYNNACNYLKSVKDNNKDIKFKAIKLMLKEIKK